MRVHVDAAGNDDAALGVENFVAFSMGRSLPIATIWPFVMPMSLRTYPLR
jgi:hypothetical protein